MSLLERTILFGGAGVAFGLLLAKIVEKIINKIMMAQFHKDMKQPNKIEETQKYILKEWIKTFDLTKEEQGQLKTLIDIVILKAKEEGYNEGLNIRKEYCDPSLIAEIKKHTKEQAKFELSELQRLTYISDYRKELIENFEGIKAMDVKKLKIDEILDIINK